MTGGIKIECFQPEVCDKSRKNTKHNQFPMCFFQIMQYCYLLVELKFPTASLGPYFAFEVLDSLFGVPRFPP